MTNRLKFDVISARIVDDSKSKKYVAYTIVVETSGETDPHPAVIERRYSDFLLLYNALKREQPEVLTKLNFPRKVLIGNFSSEMISSRSACFEQLLELISCTSSLKELPAFISFLYHKDMILAHSLIERELYEAAKPVVENSFWLLSKFWTDRAPAVLRCLCLLVAIMAKTKDPNSLSLATLALHRYQAVSDVDLLKYYVPLLVTVKDVSLVRGQDIAVLCQHLDELKKKGYKVIGTPTLLQAVMSDLRETINKI